MSKAEWWNGTEWTSDLPLDGVFGPPWAIFTEWDFDCTEMIEDYEHQLGHHGALLGVGDDV